MRKQTKATKATAAQATAPAPDAPAPAAVTYTARAAQRDNATIAAMLYPYGQQSDRDTAYQLGIADAMRPRGGTCTLADIHAAGHVNGTKSRNRYYTGASAKATDAGAIERLCKSGFMRRNADGSFSITEAGAKLATYTGNAAAKPEAAKQLPAPDATA